MLELLKEQLLEYTRQLEVVEKEMIRKYKLKEDFDEELTTANGLKMLQKETIIMMSNYS